MPASILPVDDLYRKIEVTTRTRFNAAHRLATHNRLTQWTLAVLSVELILIPLLQAMDVPLRADARILNSIEVFLGVMVLAYSQLLGAENYAVRSEKMLNCGLDLGRLSRELVPYIGQSYDETTYKHFSERYHNILDRYDNHHDVDYDIYRIKNRKKFYPTFPGFAWAWLSIHLRYLSGFVHYLFVFIFTVSSIWFLFS